VRPDRVGVLPPPLDEHRGLEQRVERFPGQQLARDQILVTAATALGRSPRNPRSRLGSEITYCRKGTGGIT
jgi:hypothetical protein